MRVLAILLANIMWLTPSVQVFASTMADTHCRAHGHISAAAPDAAHDAKHAQHHAGMADHAAPQQNEDSDQCKCGCICGLAYVTGTALAPSLTTADALAPEHFSHPFSSAHPHSIHAVLQRPPISS